MATALVRQVAVGASFTVAITVDGKVYQMGATGASGRAKWEGAKAPELVRTLNVLEKQVPVLGAMHANPQVPVLRHVASNCNCNSWTLCAY